MKSEQTHLLIVKIQQRVYRNVKITTYLTWTMTKLPFVTESKVRSVFVKSERWQLWGGIQGFLLLGVIFISLCRFIVSTSVGSFSLLHLCCCVSTLSFCSFCPRLKQKEKKQKQKKHETHTLITDGDKTEIVSCALDAGSEHLHEDD